MITLFHSHEVWYAVVVALVIVALVLWRRPKAVIDDEPAPLSPESTDRNPRECPPYRDREAQPARDRDAPPIEPLADPRDRRRRADDDGPHAAAMLDEEPTADVAPVPATPDAQAADNRVMTELLMDPTTDRRELDVPVPITADNLASARPVVEADTEFSKAGLDTGWEAENVQPAR